MIVLDLKEEISMEVCKAVKPIVVDLAKQNVLSLSNDIVPQLVDKTVSDLSLLQWNAQVMNL